MKYRGLTFDREAQEHKWVYGMPSYGFETEKIAEIGTTDGEFYEIDPETLGEETEYKDRHGRQIYTGDIVVLEEDGGRWEFVVNRATFDQKYNVSPEFVGGVNKVRVSGVVALRWVSPDGTIQQLLPCVDSSGSDSTAEMEIIGTVHEREGKYRKGDKK